VAAPLFSICKFVRMIPHFPIAKHRLSVRS
jgi:hypothetical protein